jgi:hypothetical protein
MRLKSCLYILALEMMNGSYVKLCKNLVHIFVLYAFLNLLVYLKTRAWNTTLWEANAYDQI